MMTVFINIGQGAPLQLIAKSVMLAGNINHLQTTFTVHGVRRLEKLESVRLRVVQGTSR